MQGEGEQLNEEQAQRHARKVEPGADDLPKEEPAKRPAPERSDS